MILAHHLIFTTYGFWLPNDPRGSWSEFVRTWELFKAGGPSTKTTARRSAAGTSHGRTLRQRVKQFLQFPAVVFNGRQALAVAHGFGEAAALNHYAVFACAILPEHVHLVVGRHTLPAHRIAGHFKRCASLRLYREGLHPFHNLVRSDGQAVSCWAEKCWKVFLNSPDDVHRAISYVRANPEKEGKRLQDWRFVIPYDESRASSARPDKQAG